MKKRRSDVSEDDRIAGAMRIRLRRLGVSVARAPWRDTLAEITLLAPVVLLTGVADSAHEVFLFVWYAGLNIPAHAFIPDVPVWAAWLVVLVIGLAGLRRTAIAAAWLAMTGTVALFTVDWTAIVGSSQHTDALDGATWLLLALLTAVAYTCSAGPRRGLTMVRPRRLMVLCAAAFAVVAARGLGHHFAPLEVATQIVLAITCVGAPALFRPQGRFAAVLLFVPTGALAALHLLPVSAARGSVTAQLLIFTTLLVAIAALLAAVHASRAGLRIDGPHNSSEPRLDEAEREDDDIRGEEGGEVLQVVLHCGRDLTEG